MSTTNDIIKEERYAYFNPDGNILTRTIGKSIDVSKTLLESVTGLTWQWAEQNGYTLHKIYLTVEVKL
jgi:hypothetical protein